MFFLKWCIPSEPGLAVSFAKSWHHFLRSLWVVKLTIISFDLLYIHVVRKTHLRWNFLRRPCCPANFFLGLARGMPTVPPQDAPACVQRLNARALRCLQHFHEKHSQHMLSSEARINMISQQSSSHHIHLNFTLDGFVS